MQTRNDDLELELPSPCLNTIDAALQRLGMLASTTDSRRQYLREMRRNKPYLQINTRYVSNVSIGFRLRPLPPHVRYKPYPIRERHRTRSENNDQEPAPANLMKNPPLDDEKATIENEPDLALAQLKKAKSLESIVTESGNYLKSIQIPNCPELEVVSNCIQNLRVVE